MKTEEGFPKRTLVFIVFSWGLLFFIFFPLSHCHRVEEEDALESAPEVMIDLSEIRKRGYLTALVDNNSFSYFIYKGQSMGFEYELLKLFSQKIGVDLKIKITSGVDIAIKQLNAGEADVLAFPLTINTPRKRRINFTNPLYHTYQVLVQRKPENWKSLTLDEINKKVIRNPINLVGKDVHVIAGTSFEMRLRNLSEELGADIRIMEDTLTAKTESLIQKVAIGEIDYTVTDHSIAQVNASYYPNLDVKTILSVSQQIAWGVRKNSPLLLASLNEWFSRIKKEPTFMVIYNRYFNSPRTSLLRKKSDYASFSGDKISPYDAQIKMEAKELGWDWLLLAALIYQESKFEVHQESWAGARGLMQLMPATAKRFGATDRDNPIESLKAGTLYLKYLDDFWAPTIPDHEERVKFVLASYNVGLSHLIDARALAKKYHKRSTLWEGGIANFLLLKSDPKYFNDPVVKAGYCRCEEPINYVEDVMARYEEYRLHFGGG